MFSLRTVLLLLLFALITIVGSTDGGCGSSPTGPTREEMNDEQSQRYAEGSDRYNRMTLDCQTTGGGSGGNNGFVMLINLSIVLFFLIWVAVGIWCCCCRRQKVIMNAAVVQPYPGAEVRAKEMGCGMDEKTKTIAMSTAPTGKLSNGDTNV